MTPARDIIAAAIDNSAGGIVGDELDVADAVVKYLGEEGWIIVARDPAAGREMLPGDLVAHPFDDHRDAAGVMYLIAETPIWVSADRNRYRAWPPFFLRDREAYQFEVKADSPYELIKLVKAKLEGLGPAPTAPEGMLL
ncbi:MAG: hypothetical protein J0H82_26110 [Alphaproteobacteria bacterium]|jgi:hypothetical protein|nr:hypothetical protein [Alphaproteobacteria bacterium]